MLFVATVGLYAIYWFYKNWSLQKIKTGSSVWPVMRGIFSIFFTHSLFKLIDNGLKEKQIDFRWDPRSMATLYVIATILSNIADRASYKGIGSPFTDILSIAILMAVGWALYQAQLAINTNCDDPSGEMNARFTWQNYIWIALGVIFWGLIFAGIFLTLFYPEMLLE